MTHHPKTASPLENHSDVDDGTVLVLATFRVSLIDNNRVPDIEPYKIFCKSKDNLVCLIQSSGYTGPIWLSCKDHDGDSYKWCIWLDAQGITAKFWWGVPWDGTYHI